MDIYGLMTSVKTVTEILSQITIYSKNDSQLYNLSKFYSMEIIP